MRFSVGGESLGLKADVIKLEGLEDTEQSLRLFSFLLFNM